MDLIAALSTRLGTDSQTSQGLAGTALDLLQKHVGQKLGAGDASAFGAALPELPAWQAKAAELGLTGGGTGGGGLLGAAAGLLGGGSGFDISALVQVASKAGLSGTAAQQLLPVLLEFLKSRLDPALLSKILAAVPALKGGGGGGLLGALGGIMGG